MDRTLKYTTMMMAVMLWQYEKLTLNIKVDKTSSQNKIVRALISVFLFWIFYFILFYRHFFPFLSVYLHDRKIPMLVAIFMRRKWVFIFIFNDLSSYHHSFDSHTHGIGWMRMCALREINRDGYRRERVCVWGGEGGRQSCIFWNVAKIPSGL